MSSKPPYTHILKNLFHEQAAEIIPLLSPDYEIVHAFDVELPELREVEVKRPATDLEEGLVGLALPGAKVLGVIQTEWIEHSGKFERAYRVRTPESREPSFLVIEVQTEREDDKLPLRLLSTFIRVDRYVREDILPEDDIEDEDEQEQTDEREGTRMNRGYYIYPEVLCLFPSAVPADVRNEFQGKVILAFNFGRICLWEKDAREMLNTHVSAVYFLLPAMKNADAALLGVAIEELAQRFQGNDADLGRHLTGMSLMLQLSEMMPDEEKQAAQAHLKPFVHLIKNDPQEE